MRKLLLALAVSAASALTFGASAASAASPWWHVVSRTIPTHLAPGGEGTIVVQAINLGNAPTSGVYSLHDALPAGLALQEASFSARPSKRIVAEEHITRVPPDLQNFGPSGHFAALEYCKSSSGAITCSSESSLLGPGTGSVFLLHPVLPYDFIELRMKVKDEGVHPGAVNHFQVSGGGASPVASGRPVPIATSPAGFGIEEFSLVPEEEGGAVDARAGSHPYQLTSSLSLNRDSAETLLPPALPRNLHFKLPPGQVGSATAVAQCSEQDFEHIVEGGQINGCPADTAIGVAVVTASTFPKQEEHFTVPIFNLVPAPGEPARFGFEVIKSPVILDTAVRSGPGEDYGVTVNVENITQTVNLISATTSFWGTPADPSHRESRGWACVLGGFYAEESGQTCAPVVQSPIAFLTLPTNCKAPFAPSVEGVSWPSKAAPDGVSFPEQTYNLQDALGNLVPLSGCNQLAFAPTISAVPSVQSASSASGLDFSLDFADEGLLEPAGTAQSHLKDTSVTLPEGVTINPSAGVGLSGCTEAQYEAEALESAPEAGCPGASKLGSVEVETPLLPTKLGGSVYAAQPYENPFPEPENGHPGGTLVALYVIVKNPQTGILVKLAGKVSRNSVTGQLTTTFADNPQLPFAHFKLHFREGQQAPLITPAACGQYTTQATLTPWSEPATALLDTSAFAITQGVDGEPCPAGTPFSPQIEAGTLNNDAGAFSPFFLRLTRGDGDDEISSFSTTLPLGLTGIIAKIPFCPEQDIALARSKSGTREQRRPSCPSESLLGRSLARAGVGSVLAETAGKVYFAGPYDGDPFSLVSVTSAVVGPFDLGTIVIRFGLRIDPLTAQASVDPTPSEPLPHIIDGIVTHVRDIRVYIDRPEFMLNPTSCQPMAVSSTLNSYLGHQATVSSPFQAGNCAKLKFSPQFSVSTTGNTSKANGAGLSVKLAYPKGALGSYANVSKVKVSLPKALPSRLTTLQKACLAEVFDANPANCPAASAVGSAKVTTQVLPVALEGPAYFVSHGNEAFPDLTIVLKGYGVTVDLVGSTQIRNGITTSTFKATPDVPFESFELNLPQGPYSALTANTKLCSTKLTMPTEFTAQNGVVINQSTPIKVTGCKAAKLTSAQKLARALKACRKKKQRTKRKACEGQARKRYSAKRGAKKR